MYDQNNVFAKILRKEIPCEKIYEDEAVLAFKDINPSAPVHILVITKKEYLSFDDFVEQAQDKEISYFFKTVQKIASSSGLVKSGYRIITNHGDDGCQTVPHFHLHILGKKKLGPLIVGDTHHDS